MYNIATGHQRATIDEKGRVRIPAKYADILGPVVYITLGVDKRFNIMSEAVFIKNHNMLAGVNMYDTKKVNSKSLLLSYVKQQTVDGQGRITLDMAALGKLGFKGDEVEFVGMFDYIEMWSAHRYDERDELLDADSISALLEELANAEN